VVLWTRLALEPLADDGGMGDEPIPVAWEVASDPSFANVIRQGTLTAHPENAHSVHVLAMGLPEDAWLWYRFEAMGCQSRVGRTRTFPAPGSDATQMRFALASCQDYQTGYYSAYNEMVARDDIDFVVHVGDYIYEFPDRSDLVRTANPGAPLLLEQYRRRYAFYRLDPQLQAAHASFPFIQSWDDHEVVDNWSGDTGLSAFISFLQRRANAVKAFYEHAPMLPQTTPVGPDARLYRRFRFGDLAQILSLDSRQHRSPQPCATLGTSTFGFPCSGQQDPSVNFLGAQQEAWVQGRLQNTQATWNVMAQGVLMMDLSLGGVKNFDAWDGYPNSRRRLLEFLANNDVPNPVVVSGDFHSSWAADLQVDRNDAASPFVATEFVGLPISSDAIATLAPQFGAPDFGDNVEAQNPHLQFIGGTQQGYVHMDVTPERWRADYIAMDNVLSPTAPGSVFASLELEVDTQGVTRV